MVLKYPGNAPFPPKLGLRVLRNQYSSERRDTTLPPRAWDYANFTPLMYAAMYGTGPLIRSLVANGYKIDARDRLFRCTALIWSVRQGPRQLSVIQALIACRADIHATDPWGRTSLWWAAWHKQSDIARVLLRHGANVNVVSRRRESVLAIACRQGDVEMVRLLLGRGAKTGLTDVLGLTARDWAIRRKHTAIVELLDQHLT